MTNPGHHNPARLAVAGQHWLTVAQIADRFAVSDRTVWRWIADDRLKVVRVGRIVRISEEAVEALLQASSS